MAVKSSIPQWERSVLPDWKKAVKDPEIQKLWWKGIFSHNQILNSGSFFSLGIPPKLRSILWEKVIGNPLALRKGRFEVADLHTT